MCLHINTYVYIRKIRNKRTMEFFSKFHILGLLMYNFLNNFILVL